MTTLATAAFSKQGKKANKAQVMGIIEKLAEAEGLTNSELDQLAIMYNYFKPAAPAKPKSWTGWVTKAMATTDVRYYLNRLHVEGGELVATDGHRMHVCSTTLADGAYDSELNPIDENTAGRYPNWKQVIPKHSNSCNFADAVIINHMTSYPFRDKVIKGNAVDVQLTNKYGEITVFRVQTKYWNDMSTMMKPEAIIEFGSSMDSIKVYYGASMAVLMPIKQP